MPSRPEPPGATPGSTADPAAPTGPLLLPADRPENILAAVRLLREGGVVVIPTDTVYGLAASIFRPAAVERIMAIKGRPTGTPLPVLLATAADAPIVVQALPRLAWTLIDRFWPGALTLVFPARPNLSQVITQGGETVGIRVPAARSCLALLQSLGEPIIGTSANLSGRPSATTAAQAVAQLGTGVDAVLVDDNAIQAGVASTVVEFTDGQPVIHRVGAVSAADIRDAMGIRVLVRQDLPVKR